MLLNKLTSSLPRLSRASYYGFVRYASTMAPKVSSPVVLLTSIEHTR